MRLAILNITRGGFSGGYRKYLINMLPRIAEHADVKALLCVSSGDDISCWPEIPSDVHYVTCPPPLLNLVTHKADRRLTKIISAFSPDVIFIPTEKHIEFKSIPVVNMVQNMEPFIRNLKGDPWHERMRKSIQRRIAINSIKRGTATIAISEYVKEFLVNRLRVPEHKITMVYHGVDGQLSGRLRRPPVIPIEWESAFIFTAGSIRPARGLEDALFAMSDARAQNNGFRLVIAGEASPGMRIYQERLIRLIETEGLADSVCWAGKLNGDEMGWCYDHCSAFLMTSRVEACPNTALEAMSYGCVCVSTSTLPMPEIFSDLATYYPQGDWNSLSSAIKVALSLGPEQRERIAFLAKIRARQFSWDGCARDTVSALRNATLLGS